MDAKVDLQYIMDGNGNYYRLDTKNQLVVAGNREEAGLFSLFEANQRVGGGKKAWFYTIVPAEGTLNEYLPEESVECDNILSFSNSSSMEEKEAVNNAVKAPNYEYDMEQVNWIEFASYFSFLVNSIQTSRDDLVSRLSDVDKEICDLLHYVEFYDLTEEQESEAINRLKNSRIRRRQIKNELERLENFQTSIGTKAILAKTKSFIANLEKVESKHYNPRVFNELFEGMDSQVTDLDAYLANDASVVECKEFPVEEHEMIYEKTIFDGKKNDWFKIIKQQRDFYTNISQYMINLKIEEEKLADAINSILENISDSHYNAVDGYKIYKELRDLQSNKYDIQKELELLDEMTCRFDCGAMASAYDDIYEGVLQISVLNNELDVTETA